MRHLDDDPRVALIVVDPSDPYTWVSISGTTDITTEGAREQIDKLAKKYLGEDEYPRAAAEGAHPAGGRRLVQLQRLLTQH